MRSLTPPRRRPSTGSDHCSDPVRQKLWSDWLQLTSLLKAVVGRVPAAWLSGSFLTDKPVPGDIDCLYIVDVDDVQAAMADAGRARVLDVIARNGVKSAFNLNVDSFVLEWCPASGAAGSAPPAYYQQRGYWDDLWVRYRDPDPRTESLPRRGFLEVTIDGYR
ncbi:DUF6932 family protein [Nostocoides veronense]|uniref:DUF6932 family protein n=1 Tax=Nostocoides veronense TaxID=330836 RepID=UPI003CD07E33